jgi:hypothetical protein
MRQSYKKQLYCSKRAEKAKFAHQILKMKAYHIGNHNKDNAECTTNRTGQGSYRIFGVGIYSPNSSSSQHDKLCWAFLFCTLLSVD